MMVNIEKTFGEYLEVLAALSGSRAVGLQSTVDSSRKFLGEQVDLTDRTTHLELRLMLHDLSEGLVAALATASPERALEIFKLQDSLGTHPVFQLVR